MEKSQARLWFNKSRGDLGSFRVLGEGLTQLPVPPHFKGVFGAEDFDWRHLPAGFCGKCLQFGVEGFRDSRIQASPGL